MTPKILSTAELKHEFARLGRAFEEQDIAMAKEAVGRIAVSHAILTRRVAQLEKQNTSLAQGTR